MKRDDENAFDEDACIEVYPFTRQPKGDEIIIGRQDTRTFLALPSDAVEILDQLAGGKSVGEVKALFRLRYGETPDMESLLSALAAQDFVRRRPFNGDAIEWAPKQTLAGKGLPRRHFSRFPQAWARRIFGTASLAIAALVVLGGLIALAMDPSIIPNRDALFFHEHRTLWISVLMFCGYTTLFLHEMAHLIAARALGLDASLGIGHRMYVLVAETDLTALWSVPKRERYVPILAGPGLDVVSASILVLVLFAGSKAWIALSAPVHHLLRAMVVLYFLRLLWQCYFFLRTDFYYAIITALDCSNLMQDTETFLRNRLAKLLPFVAHRSESPLPPGEARAVRAYAPVWLLGRIAALYSLIFIGLPVMARYTVAIGHSLASGYSKNPGDFLDSFLFACLGLVPFLAGLSMWIKSLLPNTRRISP